MNGIRILRTITHEIGHVLFKEGHPDQGGGRAPLPGTDHTKRLMASGHILATGHRIVKAEWDEADSTMSTIEKTNPMN